MKLGGEMAQGRKKKIITKKQRITIRFTDSEYMIIKKNADLGHMSISEYLRECGLNKRIVVKKIVTVDMPEIKDIKANLGKIGSNLNQIAKYFNQGGYRSMNMIDSIHQCMDEMHSAFNKLSELAGDKDGNNKTLSS